MKIILIGERYSSNLGDGVIYDTVENICKDIYKELEIVSLDISGGSTYTKNRNLRIAKIKLLFPKLRRLLSKIKRRTLLNRKLQALDIENVDGAIFVGGQLFIEYFSQQILTIVQFLNNKNIPVIFNSCGLGKSISKDSVKYLRKALSLPNVKAISLRDNAEQFKKLYGEDIKIERALDPVTELDKYVLRKRTDTKVGIGLIEPKLFLHNKLNFSYSDYEKLIQCVVTGLEKRGVAWEFFCNGSEDDFSYICDICTKNNFSKNIADRPTSPEQLIRIINNYSTIISFRLHSHIIASSLGKNIIGFHWDDKVREFSEIVGEENYFLELSNDVFSSIEKIIAEYDFSDKNKKYKYDNSLSTATEFLSKNKFEEREHV